MNLSRKMASGKPSVPTRLIPSLQEGKYIRYRLSIAGKTLVGVSRKLGLDDSFSQKVVYGLRRSARIEAEIARLLNKPSWNDVVLEARSEIQKKPVEVILLEMEQEAQAAWEAAVESMHSEENIQRAIDRTDWSAKLKQYELEKAAGHHKEAV